MERCIYKGEVVELIEYLSKGLCVIRFKNGRTKKVQDAELIPVR